MRWILFILTILSSGQLWCSMSFGSLSYYKSHNLDTDVGLDYTDSVTVNHWGGGEDFFITISSGSSGDPANREMVSWDNKSVPYAIFDNSGDRNIIKDLSNGADSSNILSGTFSGGSGSVTLNYTVFIEAGLNAPAGQMTDTITVTLYSGTPDSYTFSQSANIQIAVQVPNVSYLSVVNSGGVVDEFSTSQTMDFGVITPRAEMSKDIIIVSNSYYSLRLTSSNGGSLKRTDTWSTEEIPYTCLINGDPVTFTAWQSVKVAEADISEQGGSRYEVRIVLDDFWDITSGVYGDTIQITLASY